MRHQPSNSNPERKANANPEPKANEQIRQVERALRAAAQGSAPLASSKARHSHGQLCAISRGTASFGALPFSKSGMVLILGLALLLPSLVGVTPWLTLTESPLADVTQSGRSIPSPVLTAPAFLAANAGETILLPIALDGTDGVPAGSAIAVKGLPYGSMLSKGQPLGDTGWKLERDEIGDLQLLLPRSAGGQTKLTIELVTSDATVAANTEILLQSPPLLCPR